MLEWLQTLNLCGKSWSKQTTTHIKALILILAIWGETHELEQSLEKISWLDKLEEDMKTLKERDPKIVAKLNDLYAIYAHTKANLLVRDP